MTKGDKEAAQKHVDRVVAEIKAAKQMGEVNSIVIAAVQEAWERGADAMADALKAQMTEQVDGVQLSITFKN